MSRARSRYQINPNQPNMPLATKIAGFAVFGVLARAWALGLQRRNPFEREFAVKTFVNTLNVVRLNEKFFNPNWAFLS